MDNQRKSLLKSLAIHAFIIAAMLVSVNFPADIQPTSASQPTEIVQAKFIDSNVIQAQEKEKQRKQQAADQARKNEQKAAQEKQQKAKRLQAEKARKLKKEQQQKEALAKQKKQEEDRRKAEEKRVTDEKLAKEKAKQEKAKKAAEKKKQEQALADELAREQAAMQAQREQLVLSEKDKYTSFIKQTITRNIYDYNSYIGQKCRLNIRLAPNGLVIKVSILSGDAALCRASQAAVLRPSKLPVSSDPAVFEQLKNINLTVEPQ